MLSVGELTRINLILKFLSSKISFIAPIDINSKKKFQKIRLRLQNSGYIMLITKFQICALNEKLKAFRFSFLGRNQAKPYNQQSGFTQSTCIYHLFTQLRVR